VAEEDLKTIRRLFFGNATEQMVGTQTLATDNPESAGRKRRRLRR
jgi:hypothetical protein